MKTIKIYLIRHGLFQGGSEDRYIGQTDVPLTREGREQLKNMAEDYGYPQADVVISSPLKRCLETAEIIYPGKEPIILQGLAEYDFGAFEGRTAAELMAKEDFVEWLKGGEDAGARDGETNGEFKKRICDTFVALVEGVMEANVNSAAVITHGGVIMALMQFFAFPEAPMSEWLTPCGCGYMLNLTPVIWSQLNKLEAVAEVPEMRRADDSEIYYGESAWEDYDSTFPGEDEVIDLN